MSDREKERLIEELENYEPYAVHFPHLTVDGKLILDVLDFLRNSKPRELTKDEWEHWKKARYRDPICMIYKQDDTRTPIWVMKSEDVHEPAYLMGEIKLFTGKPDRKDVKWK